LAEQAAPPALALPGPLPPAWADAFAGLASDPRPPALVRDTHYIVSNEDNHFVWRTSIAGRGGIYVGVGTDQNYVMAGWARPELLVLLDFDQVVVDLHRVYGVIFLNSPTPHDFLDLWEDRNVRRVEELIEALKVDAATRRGMLAAYRMAHFAVPRRLRKVQAAYKPLGVRWFLNDLDQYRYLVELFRTGRVLTVRGDLSVGGAVTAVAQAAQKAGGVVRTLYLSNAERYFPYTPGFKQSMLALPTDEKSLVVRTRARMNGAYEYIVQDAANFKRWLDWGKMTYAVELTRYRELDSASGAYFIRREPPQPKGAVRATADKPAEKSEPKALAPAPVPAVPAPAPTVAPTPAAAVPSAATASRDGAGKPAAAPGLNAAASVSTPTAPSPPR
jgi:hypothetical protein